MAIMREVLRSMTLNEAHVTSYRRTDSLEIDARTGRIKYYIVVCLVWSGGIMVPL